MGTLEEHTVWLLKNLLNIKELYLKRLKKILFGVGLNFHYGIKIGEKKIQLPIPDDFFKPKIIISKCLEFEACRYDGQIINNKYIKKLKKFIDFNPVCPEVEIGMGIPRKPIHIEKNNNKVKLYQSETGIDFSSKMNTFSKDYISNINNIVGFILKSSSPSCAISSAKIFGKKKIAPIGVGPGFFASKIIKKFPNHPKEEEKRLNNQILREQFFTSIFTLNL